ncbi:pseudouridine synthase [Dipodascopsis uninucleata]
MNGIFAVAKPTGVSSSQWMIKIQKILEHDPEFISPDARKRKRKKLPKVKMGHGGTLDPAADGVLVLGINDGTKRLSEFLNCTKCYEVVALVGCSTTTYDAEGSILDDGPVDHITNESVEEVLKHFRGDIHQIPPIYSALKVDGLKLYDYARRKEPLPRAIGPRQVTISELSIVGDVTTNHHYRQPEKRASNEEVEQEHLFREAGLRELVSLGSEWAKLGLRTTESEVAKNENEVTKAVNDPKEGIAVNTVTEDSQSSAVYPIVTLRATVSSGTYIRSIVHDLAIALGTKAHVVRLTRVRQSDWILNKNVISSEEIVNKSLKEWAPKIKYYLENGPDKAFEAKSEELETINTDTAPVVKSIV